MNKLRDLWNYLSGKKTTLGAIVAFVAGGLFTLGIIDQSLFDKIIQWDLVVLGVGIVHKAVKVVK